MTKSILSGAVAIAMLAMAGSANGAVIVSQVGTVAPDGSVGAALAGTLTVGFIGGDLAWTHTYGAVAGTIIGATLEIDLLDAENNGRLDLYAGINNGGVLFGAATGSNQGGPGPWRDLTLPSISIDNLINIAPGLFPDLADGTFNIFGDNISMGLWGTNRSLLTITTRVAGPGPQVPEPATLTLFGLGLAGLGFARRRKKLTT